MAWFCTFTKFFRNVLEYGNCSKFVEETNLTYSAIGVKDLLYSGPNNVLISNLSRRKKISILIWAIFRFRKNNIGHLYFVKWKYSQILEKVETRILMFSDIKCGAVLSCCRSHWNNFNSYALRHGYSWATWQILWNKFDL